MSTPNPPPPSPLPPPIPILLLKSPSPTPATDPYTTHLTTPSPRSPTYTPHFIPILTHTLLPDPLINLLLAHPFPYGALIFTSQRATAAFTTALNAHPLQPRLPTLKTLNLYLYTVGPATERSLLAIREKVLPGCAVYGGAEAGSGEVLARIILGRQGKEGGKYTPKAANGRGMKPVLFLTGEKRRDIILKMLMDAALGEEERIPVDEMVVYQTTELEEFEFCFARVLGQTEMAGVRWVVVFSPTAGRGMLRALGWLEGGGKVDRGVVEERGRRTFVACIGPTTREYLEREFGFRVDVVAEKPSPEGVRDGIERFMKERELNGSSEGYAS